MKRGNGMKTIDLRCATAVTLRYLYLLKRDRWLLFEMLYWPSFDIALYGYISTWISAQNNQNPTCAVITAVVFWHTMLQANFAIAKNFLSELVSGGITNLFATTISLREWIAGCALLVIPIATLVFCFCTIVSYSLFGCPAMATGWATIPILACLMINALSLGLASVTFLTYFGLRVQALIFIIGWALALASGAYYPVGLLPQMVQTAARITPLPYLFFVIRNPLMPPPLIVHNIGRAALLTLMWLVIAIVAFRHTFRRALKNGLAQLTF